MAHSPNSHYYHGGGGGQNTANSASGAAQTLQQGQIMLRQLQLMEVRVLDPMALLDLVILFTPLCQ